MEKEIEFNNMIIDIIKSDKFKSLKEEDHHGISRLEHSLNVSKFAFYLAKKLRLKNCKSITRASLLHDLFTNDELGEKNALNAHPKVAADNARKLFDISDREYNAIEAHMFPLGKKVPKYSDSWVVTIADKSVAIYECCRYKMPLKTGTFIFFMFNIMTIPIFTK